MVSQFGEIKIDERKDQHKTQLRHIRKPYSHWIVSVMSYFILIIIIKKNNNIYIVICHLFSRYLTQRLYGVIIWFSDTLCNDGWMGSVFRERSLFDLKCWSYKVPNYFQIFPECYPFEISESTVRSL